MNSLGAAIATTPCRIVLLGECQRDEFTAVLRALQQQTAADSITLQPCHSLSDVDQADLVILCQSWSDEFPADEIDQVRRRLPFARWLIVSGALCDSDGRSRRLFADAVRIRAADFSPRLTAELQAIQNDSSAALPETAGRDQVFSHQATGGSAKRVIPASCRKLYVSSSDRELRSIAELHWLQAGGDIVAQPAVADVILWDLDPWMAPQMAELIAIRQSHPDTQHVGWSGWPESITSAQRQSLGMNTVLHKLASPAGLVECLQNCGTR